MHSWWHFLLGSLVAWLTYSLIYPLSGTTTGIMVFQAIKTWLPASTDITTIRFSVSSFLSLYGSALSHLPMDWVWDNREKYL